MLTVAPLPPAGGVRWSTGPWHRTPLALGPALSRVCFGGSAARAVCTFRSWWRIRRRGRRCAQAPGSCCATAVTSQGTAFSHGCTMLCTFFQAISTPALDPSLCPVAFLLLCSLAVPQPPEKHRGACSTQGVTQSCARRKSSCAPPWWLACAFSFEFPR